MQTMYEQTMKEWRGCEAIVRQREREKHAEALARCSSGTSVERGPVERDSTISTDASLSSFSGRTVQQCVKEKPLTGNSRDISFFSLPFFGLTAVVSEQQHGSTERELAERLQQQCTGSLTQSLTK